MATQMKRPRTVGGAASKPRSQGTRLGPVRQRLINPWRAPERHHGRLDPPSPPAPTYVEPTAPVYAESEREEEILPRFATVRQGYDCPAVDQYIAELERELAETDRELAEVKARALATDDVHRELERIGEQTSAVLIAAHDQRDEILRAAREEAEQSVSEASARATALLSQAEVELGKLRSQMQATHRERERLLADVRRISAGLSELADSAAPAEPADAPASDPDSVLSAGDAE